MRRDLILRELNVSHATLADWLLPVALAAGRVQMQHFNHGVAVQTKSDATPVTAADQESEALILAALASLAPGVPVVAEEAMADGEAPAIGDTFFLVDPLDGTREFIAGRGEFTVNIALIVDGAPVFGLVYAPATHHLFVSTGPADAVRAMVAPDSGVTNLAAAGATQIQARIPDPRALVALASRSHMNAETEAFLARYAVSQRCSAGSSLKFCLVAAGEADVYPRAGRTHEWDTAAGHAILNASGGRMTTLAGGPFHYGKSSQRFRNPDYVAWGAGAPIVPSAPAP